MATSDNLFEVLYLDHTQHEAITSKMVEQHYKLLHDFWKGVIRRLESGASRIPRQIKRKYGGPYDSEQVVREHLGRTERAYVRLKDSEGREALYQELCRARIEKGRQAIMPLLSLSLRDEVLDPSEAEHLLDEGQKAGLEKDEVADLIKEQLRTRGFGPLGQPQGSTFTERLSSVQWMTEKKYLASGEARVPEAPVEVREEAPPSPPARAKEEAAPVRRRPARRVPQRRAWAMGVPLLLVLIAGGAMLYNAMQGDPPPSEEERLTPNFTVVTTTERLNVRAAPSTASDVLTTLPEGAKLGVLSARGDWYEVLVEQGGEQRRAWISSAYAERPTDPTQERIAENSSPEAQRATPQEEPAASGSENEVREESGLASSSEEPASSRPPASTPDAPEARDAQPEEAEVFVVVDQQPEMIGGMEALYNEIDYPPAAREAGIDGRVFIQFVVDENGNVTDPTVLRSPHEMLSEEALRVIRLMKFTPGQQRGEAVRVRMSTPIAFELRGSRKGNRERAEEPEPPASITFRPNASAVAEMDGNRFEITVLNGTASGTTDGETRLELEVRQKSMNFSGEWIPWLAVLTESYLVAGSGERYDVQRAASDNLGEGPVQAGDSRTGTVVFHVGEPPGELGRMTLHFAYFPYSGVQSVRIPFATK